MKKIILTFIAVIALLGVSTANISAQPYKNALGIQVGSVLGINFKSFVAPRGALEADVSYYIRNGVSATVVYQHHFELANNFYLYLGGGINLGADNLGKHDNAVFAFGVDPNLGFEYNFAGTPIALAVDYRPMINFTCSSHFDVASLRVRFKL